MSHAATRRIRSIEGQLSLLEDVPPVQYCQRCRQQLKTEQSRQRGMGPTCWKRTKQEDPVDAG